MDRNGQYCRTRDASAGDWAGSTLYNVNELFPCLQTLLRSILEKRNDDDDDNDNNNTHLNSVPLRRECNVWYVFRFPQSTGNLINYDQKV